MSTEPALERSLATTQRWIHAMAQELRDVDDRAAYACLRAALQSLRDQLPVDECADLSAQLPLILRGVYFEGWDPSRVPVRFPSTDAAESALMGRVPPGIAVRANEVMRAAWRVLLRFVSHGELRDVERCLPARLSILWTGAMDTA